MHVDAVSAVSAANVADVLCRDIGGLCSNTLKVPNILPEVTEERVGAVHLRIAVVRIGAHSGISQLKAERVLADVKVPLGCHVDRSDVVKLRGRLVVGYFRACLVPPLAEHGIAVECFDGEVVSVVVAVRVILRKVVYEFVNNHLTVLVGRVDDVLAEFGERSVLQNH